eukprot:1028848-Rhodomonas_salina.1
MLAVTTSTNALNERGTSALSSVRASTSTRARGSIGFRSDPNSAPGSQFGNVLSQTTNIALLQKKLEKLVLE